MGRKKNVIILKNGENVYPEELEQKLKRISFIKEVVVCEKNEKITALIVLKPKYAKNRKSKEEIKIEIKKLNEQISSYKRIQKIEILDKEFEKTATNKIKRKIIAQKQA